MAFRVGQEVTLINDDGDAWVHINPAAPPFAWKPKFAAVYIVTGVHVNAGLEFLIFDEGLPHCFDAREFRPVVKPTTDISIFTRMLDEARSPELVT